MKSAPSTEGANLYRRAAKIAEESTCVACFALQLASNHGPYGGPPSLFKKFQKLFQPRRLPASGGWWGDVDNQDKQGARILGLCFMAAILEAGDD